MGNPRFLHPLQGVNASHIPEGPQVFSPASSSSSSLGDKRVEGGLCIKKQYFQIKRSDILNKTFYLKELKRFPFIISKG